MNYLGGGILFCVFSYIGISAGKKQEAALKQCRAFIELFMYIKNQVQYFQTPTKEIYNGFYSDALDEIGFLSALKAYDSESVYTNTWEKAIDGCKDSMCLTKKQMNIIYSFGTYIGKSNPQLQISNFDFCISELEAETEMFKKSVEANVRLYKTLGFTAGAIAALLVL